MQYLAGKVAVVTGGNSGVGSAMSAALLRHGAAVTIVGKNKTQGELAVVKLKTQTKRTAITYLAADLSETTAVNRLADRLLQVLPHLDILIHNAGVMMPE